MDLDAAGARTMKALTCLNPIASLILHVCSPEGTILEALLCSTHEACLRGWTGSEATEACPFLEAEWNLYASHGLLPPCLLHFEVEASGLDLRT